METGKHTTCFFVADLHGVYAQYQKLFAAIANEQPHAVFLGGDLLPSGMMALASPDFFHEDFVNKVLASGFLKLKSQMGEKFPGVFLILGNDDGRMEEAAILDAAGRGAWQYSHNRKIKFQDYVVYGYSCVPPSPFQLKDWERYDVSRFVDPGCTAPDEGFHSVPVSRHELKYATIKKDLEVLTDNDDLANAIFLFHTPPYQTKLDRAALDGKMIDYAPLDVQAKSFRQHIAAARETGLPLVIHSRDADEDMARILEEETARGPFPFILHCFTSGPDLARRGLALGGYVSFSGVVTFKKASELRDIAVSVPDERLLVENDAPYLAPEPYRGKTNEPAYVAKTAARLAEVRGIGADALATLTTDNFFRLFKKVPRAALKESLDAA